MLVPQSAQSGLFRFVCFRAISTVFRLRTKLWLFWRRPGKGKGGGGAPSWWGSEGGREHHLVTALCFAERGCGADRGPLPGRERVALLTGP